MLKRKYRLNRNKDFQRVFSAGRSFYGAGLGIKAAANDLGYPRLGILISKKVSKHATVRNRLKRQLQEIFHLHLAKLPPTDLVVVCLPALKDKKFVEIKAEVEALLNKLRLI